MTQMRASARDLDASFFSYRLRFGRGEWQVRVHGMHGEPARGVNG